MCIPSSFVKTEIISQLWYRRHMGSIPTLMSFFSICLPLIILVAVFLQFVYTGLSYFCQMKNPGSWSYIFITNCNFVCWRNPFSPVEIIQPQRSRIAIEIRLFYGLGMWLKYRQLYKLFISKKFVYYYIINYFPSSFKFCKNID